MIEYTSVKNLAELCNGSTADSDSVRLGSNPGSAAKENRPSIDGLFSFFVCRTADSHTASCLWQELGSHTPTEVRQARLAGEGRGYLRYRRISCVENIPRSGIWRLRGNTKRLVLHLALLTYLLHASHILLPARRARCPEGELSLSRELRILTHPLANQIKLLHFKFCYDIIYEARICRLAVRCE